MEGVVPSDQPADWLRVQVWDQHDYCCYTHIFGQFTFRVMSPLTHAWLVLTFLQLQLLACQCSLWHPEARELKFGKALGQFCLLTAAYSWMETSSMLDISMRHLLMVSPCTASGMSMLPALRSRVSVIVMSSTMKEVVLESQTSAPPQLRLCGTQRSPAFQVTSFSLASLSWKTSLCHFAQKPVSSLLWMSRHGV